MQAEPVDADGVEYDEGEGTSEAGVEEALHLAGACTWSWDAGTDRVSTSAGAERLLGGAPGTLAELEALVHPDDRALRQAALARALQRGEPWVCIFRLARGDGARWVEERGSGVPATGGRPARGLALLLDVTARREAVEALEHRLRSESRDRHAAQAATGTAEAALRALARSEAFLESIFTSMADGLVLFGPDGRITRMNPTAREMLRYSEEECALPVEARLARHRFVDEQGRPLPNAEHPVMKALRGEVTRGQPLGVHFAGGRTLWTTAGAAPIHAPDGAIVGAVLTLADVTRLRNLQEQREDLSRMISHDLRTPLGVILAQAKLLGRRSEGAESTRARAEAIATSAQRMGTMLNDLVESALLEAGKLRLELAPVDLAGMAHDLRRRLSAPYDGERIRVEAPALLPPLLADPERLERVLVNLFTNALKYSAPGSEVVVRLAASGDQVEVAVEDRGQGISPEDVPHLFERYFRALGAAGFEGMGLGLYTARMLVEAHGGSIAVSTVPGQGSVFRVRLPLRPPGA